MTAQTPVTARAFSDATRAAFAAAYPDAHAKLSHDLVDHPLFAREALAQLAERMPKDRVEWNLGKLPLGVRAEDTPGNGLSVGDTVRTIDTNGSWMVLKNVERDREYGALLDSALSELDPLVWAKTGPMVHREAFIFLSSPGSVTPFHMDPEHNILLQIAGQKVMTVFPARDEQLVPAEKSEDFAGGGHRNLTWRDEFLVKGDPVVLNPGDAILVPVKAPHFVNNGPTVSISFSVTWRSERSVAESELHSLNAQLRKLHLPVGRVGAAPEKQVARRFAYKVIRKLGG